MSHTYGRTSSENIFSVFSKQSKNTKQKCKNSVTNLSASSKYCNHLNKTDGLLKLKRLKTRKERSQMRDGWKETSKTKSFHHHCHCKSRRDAVFFQSCCHNSGEHQTSKRISSVVPAALEPSIITESRLIGHHRLFNHNVKSIDIERLLSKEKEVKHNGQKAAEENNGSLNLSSASHIPVQLSSDDVTVGEKAEPDAKTSDNPKHREVKNLPGSDVSPGQRLLQHTVVSSGSFKSVISSKHSSHSVEKKKATNCLLSKKRRKYHLTPPSDGDDVKTPNGKQPPVNQQHQIQADGLKSGSLHVSSSPTADGVIQHRRHDPEHVAKTVTAVAARLCGSLRMPFLKRHSLLSESRNVLQKALQKRHGRWLQANLLEIQRCVGYDVNPTQASHTERKLMEKDELWPTDTSVKSTGSRPFNWEPSPQLHQGLQKTAEDSIKPVDPSDNFLEEILRPSFSHHSVDFEPSGAAVNDFFACSPKLFQEEKASSSDLWEDLRSKKEDYPQFKSFPNSFMSPARDVTDISCEQQRHTNIQPFFPFQVGHPEDLIEFPKKQNPFETDRYSLPPSFSTQNQHHLQPFDQLSPHPNFRRHHTDMMFYPPSFMLELSSAPPSSSLPSPEQWSFPPMRLY